MAARNVAPADPVFVVCMVPLRPRSQSYFGVEGSQRSARASDVAILRRATSLSKAAEVEC